MLTAFPTFGLAIKAVSLTAIGSLLLFMTMTSQHVIVAYAQLSGATGAFQQQQQEQQQSATALTPPTAQESRETGTTTFIDIGDGYGLIGFRIQIPEGWVFDVLESAESSKRTIFGDNYFVRIASLCKEKTSLPSIIGDKTYHCGEHGSSESEVVHIQAYSITEDPLLHHMDILDDNPLITNVRAVNSVDTTVKYIALETNQTIRTLPAQRVDLVLTHVDGSQSVESILLRPRAENIGEHYVLSYSRPLTSVISTPQQQAEAIILQPEIQQIFDSFQLVCHQRESPPVGDCEVFEQSPLPLSQESQSQQ